MEDLCHHLFELSIILHMLNRQADCITTCGDCWVANCMYTILDVTGVIELHKDSEVSLLFW